MADAGLIDCVKRLSATARWTFGVCNGVELLGGAGLLAGRTVTTNWFARDAVARHGATVLYQRFVRDGSLLTAAGVSSSIDAALFLTSLLASEQVARTIQLGIEYYPAPPFGGGTPDTQPQAMQDIVASVERNGPRQLAQRHIPFANVTPNAEATSVTPGTQTRSH